jgi:anti-sigma B factor antagonist
VTESARPHREQLQVGEHAQGDVTIVEVIGNLDMAAAPVLAHHLGVALRRRPPVLVVDLTHVKFLTTAGMSILMEAHRTCQDSSMTFAVVAEGPLTMRPMQLLGIDGLFPVHPTISAALGRHQP